MYQSVSNISLGLTTPLAKFHILGSGSAATSSIFVVDGAAGRLFTVNDSLSGSLFSVNLVSGLPVIEAFSDNTVRIGQYGQKALYVSQSAVGIGTETPKAGYKLEVSGSDAIIHNVRVGRGAGADQYSTAVGSGSLSSNTSGTFNTAIGRGSMASNTIGYYNTALGYNSLSSNTTGYYNTALGHNALTVNNAVGNTAVGLNALAAATSNNNTAVGVNANVSLGSGGGNTSIGYECDYTPDTFSANTSNTISITSKWDGDSGTQYYPRFWAPDYYGVGDGATDYIFIIDYIAYGGFAMDYMVEQSGNKGQRTGTLWANFDQGIAITSNEQVTADIGDTTDVILSVVFNGGYTRVLCDNSSNDKSAYFSLSFRLLPRYRNYNPY
jgi:hypothetical protein